MPPPRPRAARPESSRPALGKTEVSRATPTAWRDDAARVRPMLAVLADQSTHDRWLRRANLVFEPKYDGIRALIEIVPSRERSTQTAGISQGAIRIWSRLGNDKTSQFPEIVAACAALQSTLDRTLLVDGEIVAIAADGRPLGFQHLQGRLHLRGTPVSSSTPAGAAFIAFDLLREGDEDLRPLPFTERRVRLERYFARDGDRLRLSGSRLGGGEALRKRAEREGWEGLIAKEPSSKYLSGRRHPAWQKLKFVQTEELIVGGWTMPRGSRQHFGALLVGRFAKPETRDALVYAGSVGTGFTDAELKRLSMLLRSRATDACPFDNPKLVPAGSRWVRPEIVAQVKFTEWTRDGLLRNPVYLGLRDDKRAEEINPTPVGRRLLKHGIDTSGPGDGRRRANPAEPGTANPNREPRTANPKPAISALLAQLEDLESRRRRGTIVLPGGFAMEAGNLDKIFWPSIGATKGALLRYYIRVAPYLLPAVAERPLVMKRFPNGVNGQSFYQHRAPAPLPQGIRTLVVREKVDEPGSGLPYLIGGSLSTLLYMAQLAVISQDPWFSRLPRLETADLAAFDLDPMPGVSFAQVLDVACWIHDELEQLGAWSVAKTSGSSGLHIYIPLPPQTPYEAGMIFCQIVATVVATRHPKQATIERMVRDRKAGTVYIDFLQNIYGKTLATAYSARASEFAGVSTPLAWQEVRDGVKQKLDPADFTIRSIFSRLESTGDLWAPLRKAKPVKLEAVFKYEKADGKS